MPKNVIVVGTPRSGTSLAASIFAGQGYFVADDAAAELRRPDHYNPGGYWEAEPLIEANVSLFRRVGYEHHNTWVRDAIEAQQAAALSGLEIDGAHRELVGHYETNGPWVWKDPRLCYTLGYWWSMVDQENTAVMLVKRNYDETFTSFARIGWREDTQADREEVHARMAAHITAAEDAIERLSIPHVTINYADYQQAPEAVASKLSEMFGVKLNAGDLGFSKGLSSSTTAGRLRMFSEKAVRIIPLPVRNAIRRMIPKKLLQKAFPGRARS